MEDNYLDLYVGEEWEVCDQFTTHIIPLAPIEIECNAV